MDISLESFPQSPAEATVMLPGSQPARAEGCLPGGADTAAARIQSWIPES